jgi:flagellar basal body-associated protein FliL
VLSAHALIIVAIFAVFLAGMIGVAWLLRGGHSRGRDDDDPGHEPGPAYGIIAQ